MGCAGSRNHVKTSGGKKAKYIITNGFIDSKGIVEDASELKEIKQAMYNLLLGEHKSITNLTEQKASHQKSFHKRILRELWDYHLSCKKEPKELRDELLPPEVAINLLQDYIDATYDYAVELRDDFFYAKWGILKPIVVANGVNSKSFERKGHNVFKKVKKTMEPFFRLYDAPEGWIEGHAKKWKIVRVKIPPPPGAEGEEAKDTFVDKVQWEDFYQCFSETELAKKRDANWLLSQLVPEVEKAISLELHF
eukprot:jgi/Bigna1/89381/estExt_fgenesh1_pg.C_480085